MSKRVDSGISFPPPPPCRGEIDGCFQKIGVPQNGWLIMENPIKMDDLGVPLFLEIHHSQLQIAFPSICLFYDLKNKKILPNESHGKKYTSDKNNSNTTLIFNKSKNISSGQIVFLLQKKGRLKNIKPFPTTNLPHLFHVFSNLQGVGSGISFTLRRKMMKQKSPQTLVPKKMVKTKTHTHT